MPQLQGNNNNNYYYHMDLMPQSRYDVGLRKP